MSSRRKAQFYSNSSGSETNRGDSTLAKIARVMGKPVASAAAAYAIAWGMGQANYSAPFFGKTMTFATMLGLAVGGGNLIANNISEWVIANLDQYKPLNDWEKSIATPAITAVGALGLLYLGDRGVLGISGLVSITGSSILASVAGDYIFENWLAVWFEMA